MNEDESDENLQKKRRTAELINHKWDVAKLAALGFEVGVLVKEKPKGKSDGQHATIGKSMKEPIWKIVSFQDDLVCIDVSVFFGTRK